MSNLYKLALHEFDQAYDILRAAFPSCELRPYSRMRRFFIDQKLVMYGYQENSKLMAVMVCWDFESFVFLENFAVHTSFRNKGIGGILLENLKQRYPQRIILEVEEPYDDMSRRRIHFYQRYGFLLNEYGYVQPPLDGSDTCISLLICSYPDQINEMEFYNIKDILFEKVYKKLD